MRPSTKVITPRRISMMSAYSLTMAECYGTASNPSVWCIGAGWVPGAPGPVADLGIGVGSLRPPTRIVSFESFWLTLCFEH